MEKSEVQQLIKLRQNIINYYNNLDGRGANISVTNTKEVAAFCEQTVKILDGVLSNHVNFENKG